MWKNQTQVRPSIAVMTLIVIGLIFFGTVIIPLSSRSHEMQGNYSALYDCKNTLRIWKNAEPNSPRFDFSKLSQHDAEFILIWADGLDVWAKTNFIWQVDKTKREIVLVYGIQFDNVPKSSWIFFLKNPAHAVGYSDGTIGLISLVEFTNLNLNGFVSLQNLTTNSEFDIHK
jgi:hypothetical protein